MKKLLIVLVATLIAGSAAFAQKITVTGSVKDASGEAVIGAGIIIKGTTTGTTSDFDGKYTIEVEADGQLEFSAIGFSTETVAVDNRAIINVVLKDEFEQLSETIVVAYGTAKKESFTGSAAVVKGDVLQKRTVGNISKSFEGTTPGVQVTSGGGQPGEGASIRIRGTGSINASATPLFVVDGV
nr:carboxypeptidase-like regulatory domain-containing protein [Bacteroidales bacterium]